MHELSIAMSIVEVACEEMERRGAARATAVHLRVGAMAGVVSDALHFCFEAAAHGTPIEGARLNIETVPLRARCDACGAESTLPSIAARRCATCGVVMATITGGDELEIVAMELIDP